MSAPAAPPRVKEEVSRGPKRWRVKAPGAPPEGAGGPLSTTHNPRMTVGIKYGTRRLVAPAATSG